MSLCQVRGREDFQEKTKKGEKREQDDKLKSRNLSRERRDGFPVLTKF